MLTPKKFRHCVLGWFETNGRKELPWQQNVTPYRVWVSEVMLQQTQVKTVIPYFNRFMDRFPTVQSLANAPQDEVLHYWSGLGYYSRVRNLHCAAKVIHEKYSGEFPEDLETLQQLPGIGRSTAGAILSLGFQKRAAILDGNVKRLLARLLAIEQPMTDSDTLKKLWEVAEQLLPTRSVGQYNQALMDLGSLVCTRTKPQCEACPLTPLCLAFQTDRTHEIPRVKSKASIPIRTVHLLIIQDAQGRVLLEKRPPVGIWGGLWSFPIFDGETEIGKAFQKKYSYGITLQGTLSSFYHTFSHVRWAIHPTIFRLNPSFSLSDTSEILWINPKESPKIGLPKPIMHLLERFGGQIS